MNTIEVLYAHVLWAEPEDTAVPVVRYADHCAMAEQMTKRCEELVRELERMALLSERLQLEVNTLKRNQPVPAGRWDTLPKAL